MFEPGTQVGRYEIQRRLGRGGMGAVYVAHDPVLGRMVAIKVFAGDLDVPDARERFSREARAAAVLSHPNIVTVYDFGEFESQPFIVMEYVPGETIAGFIRRKAPVSMADKLRWMEELCAGAGYAHQMQLVHRDIKPANLIIDRTGRLKILDFGIARLLGTTSNTSAMIGTPGYMAPEQITGEPVDHRADQFSSGVVFYELLAYAEAFPGDTLPMITHRILTAQPAPLRERAPDAPAEAIAIVERALNKNAADRFPDSEAMRAAIARVRREYSSNAAWNAPTIVASRDVPSASMGTRGTGSARRRQDEAVGIAQLTPPPDPKRADREALARRRLTQLEAALRDARSLLARNQLEAALDACHQALTLDENHIGALQLEEEIQSALRAGEGTALDVSVAEAFDLAATVAHEERPSAAVAADAAVAEVGPAPIGVSDRTVLRVPVTPSDATIVAPSRRTPPPASSSPARQTSAPRSQPAASTQGVAEEPTKRHTSATRAARGQKQAATINQQISELLAKLAVILKAAQSVVITAVARNPRVVVGAVAVALIAVVAIAVTMLMAGPAPSGALVIDAVPWASVTAIETESGQRVELPSPSSTPLSLTLPEGTYHVVLTGPPPELQSQRLTVRVDRDTTATMPVQRFRVLTPEEYFEEYLAGPAPPVPSPPASEGSAAPAPGAVQ